MKTYDYNQYNVALQWEHWQEPCRDQEGKECKYDDNKHNICPRVCREYFWQRYFQIHSQDGFRVRWEIFIQGSVATTASPKRVTNKIMEQLIKKMFFEVVARPVHDQAPNWIIWNWMPWGMLPWGTECPEVYCRVRGEVTQEEAAHQLKKELQLLIEETEHSFKLYYMTVEYREWEEYGWIG